MSSGQVSNKDKILLIGTFLIQITIMIYNTIINVSTFSLPMISTFYVNLGNFKTNYVSFNYSLNDPKCVEFSYVFSDAPGLLEPWCIVFEPRPDNNSKINDEMNTTIYELSDTVIFDTTQNNFYFLLTNWCSYNHEYWGWISVAGPFLFAITGLYLRIIELLGVNKMGHDLIEEKNKTKCKKWLYDIFQSGLTSVYWVPILGTYCDITSNKNPIWLSFSTYLLLFLGLLLAINECCTKDDKKIEYRNSMSRIIIWVILIWSLCTSVWSWVHGDIIFSILSIILFIYNFVKVFMLS